MSEGGIDFRTSFDSVPRSPNKQGIGLKSIEEGSRITPQLPVVEDIARLKYDVIVFD